MSSDMRNRTLGLRLAGGFGAAATCARSDSGTVAAMVAAATWPTNRRRDSSVFDIWLMRKAYYSRLSESMLRREAPKTIYFSTNGSVSHPCQTDRADLQSGSALLC